MSARQFCIGHSLYISGSNLTKLALIHHWDKAKKLIRFGDFDPIFKVTGGLGLLNCVRRRGTFSCSHNVSRSNKLNFTKHAWLYHLNKHKS